jgi:ABC-2 type transport system ATP-binding protein
MQHWVARDTSVPVLHGVVLVDQNGNGYASPSYPPPSGAPFSATGSGTLALVAGGGSGPPTIAPNAQAANAVDAVAYAVTPAPASNALNVQVSLTRHAVILGAPTLTLTYSGSVAPGARPTRVFAQLVDPVTGIVVGNQVTPVPVTLDGRPHTVAVPMETVAYTAMPGTTLELQLVSTTVAYATPRLGGSVDFSRIGVVLPTANDLSVLK